MNTNTNHCSIDTARRLLKYAALLAKSSRNGRDIISLRRLSAESSVDMTTIREDIAMAGISTCNVPGYSVEHLIRTIENYLGRTNSTDTIIVGTHETIESTRAPHCNIIAAFDVNDPTQAATIDDIKVFHVSKLSNLVERMQLRNGILAVPPESAQQIANMMVTSGITEIWNHSGADIQLPESVSLHCIS